MKQDSVMYAVERIFKANLSPWHYAARKRIKELYPLMDEWICWSERECIIEQLVGESESVVKSDVLKAGDMVMWKTKRGTIHKNEGWIRKRVEDRINSAIESMKNSDKVWLNAMEGWRA